MASPMYDKLLPDYGDLDNQTGRCPGFRVYIVENDGGVGLSLVRADEDPVTSAGSGVFMNVDEAKEMLAGLQDAIDRAQPKRAAHPRRGREA